MHMNEEIVAHYNIEGSTFIWFRGESYLVPANAKADRRRLTDEMASFSLLIDGRELAVLQYKLPDLSLFEYPYDVLTEPPEYEDFFLYLKNTINDGSLFRQANKPYHFGDFMSVRKEGVWKKMKRVFEGK